MHNFW